MQPQRTSNIGSGHYYAPPTQPSSSGRRNGKSTGETLTYWCNLCQISLNSKSQMSQHRSSSRHRFRERNERMFWGSPNSAHSPSLNHHHSSASSSTSTNCNNTSNHHHHHMAHTHHNTNNNQPLMMAAGGSGHHNHHHISHSLNTSAGSSSYSCSGGGGG